MERSAAPADLRFMKKNDIILIGILLALSLAAFGGAALYAKLGTRQPQAVVYLKGKEKGRYPLSENITLEIRQEDGGYNILKIEGGKADITGASCPDKVCVRQRPAGGRGESLVCLPNQLTVEIENGGEDGLDGSTN